MILHISEGSNQRGTTTSNFELSKKIVFQIPILTTEVPESCSRTFGFLWKIRKRKKIIRKNSTYILVCTKKMEKLNWAGKKLQVFTCSLGELEFWSLKSYRKGSRTVTGSGYRGYAQASRIQYSRLMSVHCVPTNGSTWSKTIFTTWRHIEKRVN